MGTLTKGPILLDAYYTPQRLANFLVELLPITDEHLVLEPSAGGGAFVRALLKKTSHVYALDINPMAKALDLTASVCCDFLEVFPPNRPDWIIGNPPYYSALEHVEHALECTERHVCFLLRLSFLESKKRAAFWAANPCRKVFVLSQRPSFTGGKTDSSAYALFWWDNAYSGETVLDVVSWQ